MWDHTVLSLELSDLPYIDGTLEDWLAMGEMEALGPEAWEEEALPWVVPALKKSFIADYVVLGGGNAKCIERLPRGVELGHNPNAFTGGVRLWQNAGARTSRARWNII